MTLLFLSRLYYPHVGGVEKHVKNISEIFSKKHRVIIITEQHDSKLPEYEKYPEAEVYRIPISRISEKNKKWVIWKWFWQHRNLVRDADIVHAHDVFFWILPLRFIYCLKQYFLTFHGYEGTQPPNFKQIFWHKLGEFLTSGNISIGAFIPKWYKTKTNFISYGAVDDISETKKPNNKTIYLGRLSSDTGIMDYLAAAKKLDLQLDVYGDGPQLEQSKIFSQNNNLKTKYLGFVPDAAKYLPGYKVAFVSRYLSILEALIAKVPVIAHFDSQIKKDYLSMAPFAEFIDICSNPSEIEIAYKYIVSNHVKTQTRIKAGYNWARSQTWAKLADTYEHLWQQNTSLKSQS